MYLKVDGVTMNMFGYKTRNIFESFSIRENSIFSVEKLSKVLLACIQTSPIKTTKPILFANLTTSALWVGDPKNL